MLNFREQTGSSAVINLWSFLLAITISQTSLPTHAWLKQHSSPSPQDGDDSLCVHTSAEHTFFRCDFIHWRYSLHLQKYGLLNPNIDWVMADWLKFQGAELKGIKYVKDVQYWKTVSCRTDTNNQQIMYWFIFQYGEVTNWLDQKRRSQMELDPRWVVGHYLMKIKCFEKQK